MIEVSSFPQDDRFVIVTIEGQDFHAFVEDVDSSCEPLPSIGIGALQPVATAA
jgi:hypothetical protein